MTDEDDEDDSDGDFEEYYDDDVTSDYRWRTLKSILGTLKKASAAAFQGTGSDPL